MIASGKILLVWQGHTDFRFLTKGTLLKMFVMQFEVWLVKAPDLERVVPLLHPTPQQSCKFPVPYCVIKGSSEYFWLNYTIHFESSRAIYRAPKYKAGHSTKKKKRKGNVLMQLKHARNYIIRSKFTLLLLLHTLPHWIDQATNPYQHIIELTCVFSITYTVCEQSRTLTPNNLQTLVIGMT